VIYAMARHDLLVMTVLAGFGAIFGTLGDVGHVWTGAISFDHPSIWGIGWWVPPQYAAAVVAIAFSHTFLDGPLGREQRFAHTPPRLIAGIAATYAVWMSTGLLDFHPWLVAGTLAPVALLVWWFFDRTWQGLLLGLATAIVGVSIELLLVSAGVFNYTHPDTLAVGVSFGCVYLPASVAVGNLGRWALARAPLTVADPRAA